MLSKYIARNGSGVEHHRQRCSDDRPAVATRFWLRGEVTPT